MQPSRPYKAEVGGSIHQAHEPRLTGGIGLWLDVAMRRVKIAELKDQLSKHLRTVEKGAEVEVTHRDRPVARLIPIREHGRVRAAPPKRPFSQVRRRRHRPTGWGVSSTELLLEERQRR